MELCTARVFSEAANEKDVLNRSVSQERDLAYIQHNIDRQGTVTLRCSYWMRCWMSVGQPVPWPSVPERYHLALRLALLPFRHELSRCGRDDGSSWSDAQLRDGPALGR